MAHPHQDVRQSKVEHSRVARLTRGYASGGAVAGAAEAAPKAAAVSRASGGGVGGAPATQRSDRIARARGGRIPKKSSTTVNVIVAPKESATPGPIGVAAAPPPMMPPPKPPMPGPMAGPPPGMPIPGGPPPGMPPRSHGGRTYASGGAVKSGPAWEEGKRNGTQVQHDPGKNDLKDMNRKRVITYKTGGAVEAPTRNATGKTLKMRYGAGGEKGREEKIRKYGPK